MNIILFGATGTVGIEILTEALAKGHQLTAFVRNPEKLPLFEDKNLIIHKGDVLKLEDVKKAMYNQGVVLCVLGDGKIGKIRAEGTKNILSAMSDFGVKRLICQTTLGMGESYGNLNFMWKHIMFGLFLKKAFQDHKLQEHYIQNSNVNYTIVRPSALTKGPVTNNYKVGFSKDLKGLSLKISRQDVADFMLKQITSSDYIRKCVSISN